ncbi:MAG: hypothetical protein H7A19_18355 [Rhodanobacteraceae bacterium]|nr:hypothetical protein [Rhodanobacteraceae bacterium]
MNHRMLVVFAIGLLLGLLLGVGAVTSGRFTLPVAQPSPGASGIRAPAFPTIKRPDINVDTMIQLQQVRDALHAAEAMIRVDNLKGAAGLYERVLTQFDCSNQEARTGLKAVNPGRYAIVAKACPGANPLVQR